MVGTVTAARIGLDWEWKEKGDRGWPAGHLTEEGVGLFGLAWD